MLAATPTYLSAQIVVAALVADQWDAALAEMGKYAGDELQLVADKSIALGADPATVKTLLDSLQGETIHVEGKAPVLRKTRLAWQPFAIVASILVGFFAGSQWKRRAKRKVA